jgi:predicted HicB family RNase H-like nuclease
MKSPGRPQTEAAEFEHFTLRLPPELMTEVRVAAAHARLSINTQMRVIVEQWAHARKTPDKVPTS